jgi:hypothetical protein
MLVACGDSSDNATDTVETASLPQTEAPAVRSTNPPCESLAFGDGRGGDLWLNKSESNGLPVYLLNSGWQDAPTVEAELFGGGLERGNFTGFANPDGDGRLRPHYRFSRSCGSYTGLLIVTDVSQSCEVRLPATPCQRID